MDMVSVMEVPVTRHSRLKSPWLTRFTPAAGEAWGDAAGTGLAAGAAGAGLAKGDGAICKSNGNSDAHPPLQSHGSKGLFLVTIPAHFTFTKNHNIQFEASML
jgi:F0F1-type ATP synthase membrane subunit c/vacuolar-type H+-ATPase subunit K